MTHGMGDEPPKLQLKKCNREWCGFCTLLETPTSYTKSTNQITFDYKRPTKVKAQGRVWKPRSEIKKQQKQKSQFN